LPAGSLLGDTTYTCDLAFVRVAGVAAGDADIGTSYATLAKDTGFMLRTIALTPTPSPTRTPRASARSPSSAPPSSSSSSPRHACSAWTRTR
jgi:hypothetical protein